MLRRPNDFETTLGKPFSTHGRFDVPITCARKTLHPLKGLLSDPLRVPGLARGHSKRACQCISLKVRGSFTQIAGRYL